MKKETRLKMIGFAGIILAGVASMMSTLSEEKRQEALIERKVSEELGRRERENEES